MFINELAFGTGLLVLRLVYSELIGLVFVGNIVAMDALEDDMRASDDLVKSVALDQVFASALGELCLSAASAQSL